MQKKGIILVNEYAELKGISYSAKRLQEEFSRLGIFVPIIKPSDLSYGVFTSNSSLSEELDFCVFLDKDNYLSRTMEASGVRLFNSSKAIFLCDDKMLTYLTLAGKGIPVPDTIPSMLCYTQGKEPSKSYLKEVEEKLCFPLVAKMSFGSLGKGVRLICSREELFSTEKEWLFSPHLYQKYIPARRGEDVRLLVIGGKTVACMRRKNEKDFRSNIEIGGVGEIIQPPESFLRMAEKAASLLGLDYCGVDLLFDENEGPVLCEVNSNAFFEGIERTTGVNVGLSLIHI